MFGLIISGMLLGIGATVVFDFWQWLVARVLGQPCAETSRPWGGGSGISDAVGCSMPTSARRSLMSMSAHSGWIGH